MNEQELGAALVREWALSDRLANALADADDPNWRDDEAVKAERIAALTVYRESIARRSR